MSQAVEQYDVIVQLSEPQTAVMASRQARILNMAGQGSGKSQVIGYSSGMFVSDFPQMLGFIGANTYLQLSQSTLVRVFETWAKVYGFTEYDAKTNPGGAYIVDKRPPFHFQRFHKLRDYGGTISFYNGCLIFLGSLDNYKAHDGKEFGWAHLDETKDTNENALKDVITGRLRQFGMWFDVEGNLFYDDNKENAQANAARGWTAWNPLYVNTSPTEAGVDWLNQMFKLKSFEDEIKKEVLKKDAGYFFKEFENKAVVIYSVYHNAYNLPPNYIENQIDAQNDEDSILRIVYGYPFSKTGGEYFPQFRKDFHCKPVAKVTAGTVHLTFDFNVIPYMTLLAARIEFITRYLDPVGNKHDVPAIGYKAVEVMRISFYKEYCYESPRNSVEAVCQGFMDEHDAGAVEVFYYGDPSGLSRIPGLGNYTNFKGVTDALFNYLHNDSKRVKAPAVGVLKRRDLVNSIFKGRYPGVEIVIDPEECPELVADFETVKLGPAGKLKRKRKKDKAEIDGHTSDAAEYLICEVCKHLI